MDRKFAGVSAVPILAIRDVTSIANMPTVFGIFFILLYFRYSNSNIEAKTATTQDGSTAELLLTHAESSYNLK